MKIAIDDFGSEYSSFEYVRAFQINHLKLAQSFINNPTGDSGNAATIRAIVSFAHDIGIEVIAKGVETEQQCALLASTGHMTNAQGFHFSEALGSVRASELLRKGRVTFDARTGHSDVDASPPRDLAIVA